MSRPADAVLGRPRLHLRSVGSTNERGRELAAGGAPHGTLVTAGEQTAGRGRQGRTWVTPPGTALALSLVLLEYDELLSLRAGLAVADLAGPKARVKWPNDVLLGGRKVAGVLVEGRPQAGWAVLGIGVNVALDPAALPPEAAAVAGTLGRGRDELEPALAELLAALERRLAEPAEAVLAALRERDALLGRPVRWAGGMGVGAGVGADGALRVRTAAGGGVSLVAGDVHLEPGPGDHFAHGSARAAGADDPLHPSARAFARVAGAYERGRSGYPPEAVAWLAERLRLGPGRTVVDVGAGTGKLSAPLAATGARVIAVEPLAEMRAAIAPPVEAREGTAEALPLTDAAADAITAAAAFHWFDGPRALAEFRRVLRPGGMLALLWNERDERDPVQARLSALLRPLRGTTPGYRGDRWRAVFEAEPGFVEAERRRFPFVHAVSRQGLVARVESISFVAALPDARRAAVLGDVAALAAGLAEPIRLPQATDVILFRAPDGSRAGPTPEVGPGAS